MRPHKAKPVLQRYRLSVPDRQKFQTVCSGLSLSQPTKPDYMSSVFTPLSDFRQRRGLYTFGVHDGFSCSCDTAPFPRALQQQQQQWRLFSVHFALRQILAYCHNDWLNELLKGDRKTKTQADGDWSPVCQELSHLLRYNKRTRMMRRMRTIWTAYVSREMLVLLYLKNRRNK